MPLSAAATILCNQLSSVLLPTSSSSSKLLHSWGKTRHIVLRSSSSSHLRNKSIRCNHAAATRVAFTKEDDRTRQTLLQNVDAIRHMLRSISEGAVSPSPYDTAWVARIPSRSDKSKPEFPQCLDWLIENQLADGSWGDEGCFNIYDRLLSTLSCVLALEKWHVGHSNVKQGLEFVSNNMDRLQPDNGDLLVGFELIFPFLMEEAKLQGLSVPYADPYLQVLKELRECKLQKIPLDFIYSRPTTVLFSLEGLQDCIDWAKILKLQAEDGSFLTSPSSTACVYLHTEDPKCLEYLRNVLKAHGNAVPNFYPLDIFDRLWVVDTIERLGIDRYFQPEIKQLLDYVYKDWNDKGLGWASRSSCLVPELDNTGMGFRILRLHGYDVSADVFRNFQDSDKFFCFFGERNHGMSDILSLFRASHVAFPNEPILAQGQAYAVKYLKQQIDSGVLDKWAVKKDLLGEVCFELSNPWVSCPPRLYAKSYMEKYGTHDYWIAKTIYRLPHVNSKTLLDIATADFEYCRSNLKDESDVLTRWWLESGLSFTKQRVNLVKNLPARLHFQIGAYVFEPEYRAMRLAYTKMACFVVAGDDLFDHFLKTEEFQEMVRGIEMWEEPDQLELTGQAKAFYNVVYRTVNELTDEASKKCSLTSNTIRSQFATYVKSVVAEFTTRGEIPEFNDYMERSRLITGIPAIIISSLPFCGLDLSLEMYDLIANCKLLEITCDIIRLSNDLATYKVEKEQGLLASSITSYMKEHPEVASQEEAAARVRDMLDEKSKELTQVYTRQNKDGIPQLVRRIIFETARTARFVYANGIDQSRDELKLPGEKIRDVISSIV